MKWKTLLFALVLGNLVPVPALSQSQITTAVNPPKPLVSQAIDEAKLVALHGSVHPLTRAGIDQGAVSDSFATGRMILLLNRPPEREAALRQFLQDAQTHGTATYHQWLTPEQFGAHFGPADADMQTATGWLSSHGLQVAKTSKSGQFIEFSGTAGQLRDAFHTAIHQYSVNGATHYANATEIKIPAALAALVGGVSPMDDMRAKPQIEVAGPALYSRSTHKTTPQWTLPNGGTNFYAVAPEDFATQYDLGPLYNAGVNGTGQTIGIINESNIDLSLVEAYHKLFGLSSGMPQLVIDGSDPGDLEGVDVEAYLDVEEAGAVAPGATVNLYIGNSSGLFTGIALGATTAVDPLYLAALRAVDDNQAGVLSVSFGNCEGFMLQSGNALWSALWEQAAAQGQTVLVSSGDSGSAGCDNANEQWTTEYGLAVNGLASTPWNVAVGGTDFYYSDYATGGASAATLWNQSNDANLGSLKAPLPEQIWDTVYGFNAIGPYVQVSSVSIPAGGGGASGCIDSVAAWSSSGLPFVCNPVSPGLFGYAKPSWQNAPGVPADGVRDIPDVSLYAANGQNLSAYPICALPGDCVPDANGDATTTMVGGTSASAPAMAGIMALVNQKYGRQGQANYTLYQLARQFPAAFHDVTHGSNNMTCLQGTPDCTLDTADTFDSLQEYPASTGYDLASGLGSVDASVMVNDWNSISLKPTTTTMQVTPASAQHGAPISFTVKVTSASGGGTPQGNVTILNNSSAPLSAGQGVQKIDSSGTTTMMLDNLPGGSYQVWAQYAGDGSYGSSYSDPQTVTISPVTSSVNLYGFGVPGQTLNPAAPCVLDPNQDVYEQATLGGPWSPWPSGSTFGGDSQVAPIAIVNGAWPSFGTGTGSVTFTVDGAPQATVALNSFGYAGWIPPSTFDAGNHTIGAAYSGDASYAAATAAPYTLIVPKVTPSMSAWPAANCPGTASTCTFSAGDNLRVEVQIYEPNCHMPTGAVTVNAGSLSQNITLVPGGLITRSTSFVGFPVLSGEAVFQNLPAGTYPVTASYAGDANSLPNTSSAPAGPLGQYGLTYTVVATAPPAPLLATTTAMTVSPPSMLDTFWTGIYLTGTVTGGPGSTIPPTGAVDFFEDGVEIASGTVTPAGANSATVTAMASGLSMDLGSSQLKAVYSGDSVYQSSAFLETYQITIPVTPDFLLAPQLPQVTVPSGTSKTVGFNLNSLQGFNSPVALSCSTSSSQITCSLNPTTVTVNGQAATTLTINAAAKTAALSTPKRQGSARWPIAAGLLCFGFLLAGGRTSRKLRRSMLLGLILLAGMMASGCNQISGYPRQTTQPPAPTLVTYSVVVTGTANGITHNAKITVVVP